MAVCAACGTENRDKAKFCKGCAPCAGAPGRPCAGGSGGLAWQGLPCVPHSQPALRNRVPVLWGNAGRGSASCNFQRRCGAVPARLGLDLRPGFAGRARSCLVDAGTAPGRASGAARATAGGPAEPSVTAAGECHHHHGGRSRCGACRIGGAAAIRTAAPPRTHQERAQTRQGLQRARRTGRRAPERAGHPAAARRDGNLERRVRCIATASGWGG